VAINAEGTYIIHSVAFYKGFLSHDSKVITVSASSISTVQDTVDDLSKKLAATNQQLVNVQNELDRTKAALNDTKVGITDSVYQARSSLRDDLNKVEEASGQINSIILPVLALISVIIALQISLFARIRASYR
jgi:ABC-type transporter Mla subunit MlaD